MPHLNELRAFYYHNAKELEHEANLDIVDSQRQCMSHPPKVCHAKYQGKLSNIIWCKRLFNLSHALPNTTRQDKNVVWEFEDGTRIAFSSRALNHTKPPKPKESGQFEMVHNRQLTC